MGVPFIRRADGYYCQFCVKTERTVEHVPSGKELGIDVGLKSFLTDSEGNTVENPRHYRKAEKKLKRLQRRLSRKQKRSANRKKAQKRLAKPHLKVQRQREDFARKLANALVSSSDLIAYENRKLRNMVRNRKLTKSIPDAGWGIFLQLEKAFSSIRGCTGGAPGNRRTCSVKRFWTGDLYCLLCKDRWQAPWMKEEPPRVSAGECQMKACSVARPSLQESGRTKYRR